jgi:hypothetical protein
MSKINAQVANSQVPIQNVAAQAKDAVKAYLKVANSSRRSSSHLPSLLSSFLDNDYGKGIAGEYIDILAEVLRTLTIDKVSKGIKDELGDYTFDRFTAILERTTFMLECFCNSEANVAEITFNSLDTNGKWEVDEIYNRITLNSLIRKYRSMAENLTASQADWAVYDQRFE